MFADLLKEIVNRLEERSELNRKDIVATFSIPNPALGDFATTLAFIMAKKEKSTPIQTAREIKEWIEDVEGVEKVEQAGPYINITMKDEWWLKQLKKKPEFGEKRTIAIEYPSVNPNKPWHIGHLRNALLGESIARMLEETGHKVIRINYINDLGLQIAYTAYYLLKKFGNLKRVEESCKEKFDVCIGKMYVEATKLAEKEEQSIRTLLKEMEEQKTERARFVKKMCEKILNAQYETANAFGIKHDIIIFESDVMQDLFSYGMEKIMRCDAIFEEKEGEKKGCIVAKFVIEGNEEKKVLIRSDGTATYTGKDVVFQMWKFGLIERSINGIKIKADEVINIIGIEQKYPQAVIKEIIRALGYKEQANHYFHVGYEHVVLKEGKFSGRKGTWIGYTADELLQNAIAEVKKRSPSVSENDVIAVAKGAIAYSMLRQSPEKKIIFDWDKALSLEGDSGPYIQYSYVRAKRILEKAEENKFYFDCPMMQEERLLVKNMTLYPFVVYDAGRKKRPHILCNYLSNLAALFHKFYTSCPILTAEENEKAKRLFIIKHFCDVLERASHNLLIPLPNRM